MRKDNLYLAKGIQKAPLGGSEPFDHEGDPPSGVVTHKLNSGGSGSGSGGSGSGGSEARDAHGKWTCSNCGATNTTGSSADPKIQQAVGVARALVCGLSLPHRSDQSTYRTLPSVTVPSMPPRRMVQPNINEVSTVDHPAHLIEGWISMQKARGGDLSPEMTDLLARAEAMTKGKHMPDSDVTNAVDAESFEKAISGLPEEMQKALMDGQRRAVQAESLAKALLDEREDNRFEKMAKELVNLPGVDSESNEQSFAKSLREAAESTTPETFEKLFKVLKSADAALGQSGMFKEYGVSGGSTPGTAGATIEAIAKELRAADPELTEADSIAKAATENPDLYTTHRVESLRANQEV